MRFAIAILMSCAAIGFAQEHMAETLKSGIVAEDSKQDPRAALREYQAVLQEYAQARQTAAMALFRSAECFRKIGYRQPAITAYQRVVKEFGDQTKLAAQSRAVLEKTYQVKAEAATDQPQSAATRILYRQSIVNQINIAKSQLATAQSRYAAGLAGIMEVKEFNAKIAELQTQLAAYDAGLAPARRR